MIETDLGRDFTGQSISKGISKYIYFPELAEALEDGAWM